MADWIFTEMEIWDERLGKGKEFYRGNLIIHCNRFDQKEQSFREFLTKDSSDSRYYTL